MKPIFIYSPGRTGGSALVNALRSHPSIVASGQWPFEERAAGTLMRQVYQMSLSEITPEFSMFKHKLGTFHSQPKELEAYRACVEHILPRHARDCAAAFYRQLAAIHKKQASFYVEKGEVPLWLNIVEINDFSASIILVRDPRDALVSAAQFFPEDNPHCAGPKEIPKVIRLATGPYGVATNAFADRVKQLRAKKKPLLLVRYEDLVSNAEAQLGAMLDFVDPALRSGLPDVLKVWQEPQRKHMTAKTAQSSVSRWRSELPAEYHKQIEKLFAEAIKTLGYE